MPKSSHINEDSTEGKNYERIMKKIQDNAQKRDKYDIGRPNVEVIDNSGQTKKIEALRIDIDD